MSGEQTLAWLPALLSRLQVVWEEQVAPMARLARPGLSDAELDAHATALGVVRPEELRQWWRWRNGTRHSTSMAAQSIGPGGWNLLALEDVADERLLLKGSCDVMGIPGVAWDESWVPFARSGLAWLFAKTADASMGQVPIGLVWFPWEGEFGATVQPSLSDVLALWVEIFDEGYCAWDIETDSWQKRFADIPLEVRVSDLV